MSNQVQVDLRVGLLDVSLAQLITKDHQLIEFPTLLLPSDVKAGSIVRLTCERDIQGEEKDTISFEETQNNMLEAFTVNTPKTPVLRVKNTTQTSAVLEWDPIDVASATLHSLALYKNGQRLGTIPNPEKRTSTKLSNLAIDNEYNFHLVLATSAGVYESEVVKVQTHKMTDLSGLTICVGDIEGSNITRDDLEESVTKMGCKPLQDSVKLDTTHFVATSEAGLQYQRAKDMSIPIVRPEWLKACETERRLVGVRAYYLSADPRTLPPTVRRSRTATVSSSRGGQSPTETKPEAETVEPAKAEAEAEPVEKAVEADAEPVEKAETDADAEPVEKAETEAEAVAEPVEKAEAEAEPVAVPVEEPAEEAGAEPVEESIEEPAAEQVEETAEAETEPAAESVEVEADPVEPVEEAVAEPAEEPVEPVEVAVAEPVEEPVEPVEEPVEPVEEPVEPVEQAEEPIEEPAETEPAVEEAPETENEKPASSEPTQPKELSPEGKDPLSPATPKQEPEADEQPVIPEIQINSTSIEPEHTHEPSNASASPKKPSTPKSKKNKKKNNKK